MTNISRRGLLGAIFATGIAPMIGTAGILMPVKKIVVPTDLETLLIQTNIHLANRASRDLLRARSVLGGDFDGVKVPSLRCADE